MEPRLVVSLGSVNVDVELRGDGWPAFGDSLQARDLIVAGGGKAANVAYLVGRLGVPVRLIAHVGADELARRALRGLRRARVDLRDVRAVTGSTTGLTVVLLRADGEKSFVASEGANALWTEQDVRDAVASVAAAPARGVVIADLNVAPRVVEAVGQEARRRGLPFVLDPSPPDRLTDALYHLADYLTPDHTEAAELTGVAVTSPETARRAGEVLLARGVGTALVKLPNGGCAVVGPGVRAGVAAPPVEAVDSTGAGDAFAGALGVSLLEGKDVLDAARFAVAAATLKVRHYGARTWKPTRRAIEVLARSTLVT